MVNTRRGTSSEVAPPPSVTGAPCVTTIPTIANPNSPNAQVSISLDELKQFILDCQRQAIVQVHEQIGLMLPTALPGPSAHRAALQGFAQALTPIRPMEERSERSPTQVPHRAGNENEIRQERMPARLPEPKNREEGRGEFFFEPEHTEPRPREGEGSRRTGINALNDQV